MSPATRTRMIAAAVIAVVIPLGLFARSHRAGATLETFDGFLASLHRRYALARHVLLYGPVRLAESKVCHAGVGGACDHAWA